MTDRLRREPPRFREATVTATERRNPRLVRVSLRGPELEGFDRGLPASSVRLLLPRPGQDLEIPRWNGNEFLDADGRRPLLRTLTPLGEGAELDVEVVLHGRAPLSSWAETAEPGDVVAVSGPGRGYEVDPSAATYLLAGDESALPAVSQLLGALPSGADVTVLVELSSPDARVELPDRPTVQVRWLDRPPDVGPGDALVAAVVAHAVPHGVRVWAAGEAAAMQRIRSHCFSELGLSRSQCTIRGYWKRDRAAP